MADINQLVGENVQRLRLKHHLGPRELAAAAGLSEQGLLDAERGAAPLSAASLYAITRALNEPVCEFFAKVEILV